MKGWVYVLDNDSMPGLVKIGCTTRSVQSRASQFWQTGVPTPFKVVGTVFCPDCRALKKRVHDRLATRRECPTREFFRVAPGPALALVEDELSWVLHEFVNQFLPDYRIVNPDVIVDESHVAYLADQLGENPIIVASALAKVEPDELRPALARNAELRSAIARRRLLEGEGKP